MSKPILSYQQKCHSEYAQSIGLPSQYTYPDGNPIRPLPPIQTTVGSLMIIGAYPSARFESRPSQKQSNRHRLIPVADNLQPFGYEQYFDGIRVRTLTSADTLHDYLLSPLQQTLEQCWVTDLVKVFLYKSSHVESCKAVKPSFEATELRSQFYTLGKRSLFWLYEECQICKPTIILTLGQEVAQVIHGQKNASADKLLKNEIVYPDTLEKTPTLHLPHPDACRRFEKWRNHLGKQIKTIKAFLAQIQ